MYVCTPQSPSAPARERCGACVHALQCVATQSLDSTTHTASTMDDDDVTMTTTTTRTDDDDDSIAGARGRGGGGGNGGGGGGRGHRRERGDRRLGGRGSETAERRHREGTTTRDFERHNRPFRERAKTRPGWAPTGGIDPSSGRPEHSGQCEGCKVSTVVNFRPVVGGNPPLCGVCLDSLKAATGGGVGTEGERAGGPHRGGGRGRRGAERSRGGFGFGGRGGGGFHPYGAHGGGQMVMVDPRMMAAYGGHGGGMMATYGGVPGAGGGKNRSWTRDGAAAGERDVDTSGIPCMFFQRGSCRAGESCKYSHGGASDAVGGGDGDDAAMTS